MSSTRYRERMPLNLYDSITPACIRATAMRLFGSANVGNVKLSNLQLGGQLVPGDYDVMLQNWYARTEIVPELLDGGAREAWEGWTHAAVVTLVVGSMPVQQQPLSDLLIRKSGQFDWAGRSTLEDDTNPSRGLAKAVFERLDAEMARTRHVDARAWNQLSGHDQAAWIGAIEFARSTLEAPLLAWIPQRQLCHVHIETSMAKIGAFLEAAPALRDRLIWLHLEGIQCLDVD